MANSPVVSFVIPMYNVEKYIKQCVDSIVNQSFRDIEIILVDDGSPDKSGEIADQLSLEDSRIKVIHNKNQGVSSARNTGVKLASGTYIVFVDGDDYISMDYTEYMLGIASKTGADFIMSKNCHYFPGRNSQIDCDNIFVWKNEKAVYELLYPGKVAIGCWNKMFRRDFLIESQISFSTDLYMGEGLNFIVEAAQVANKIAVGSKRVYYYRQDNLMSATTVVNVSKYINALAALKHIKSHKTLESELFDIALESHEYLATFFAFRAILITEQSEKYSNEYIQYISRLRKGVYSLFKMDISIRAKIKILLFSISPKLISFVIKTIRR